LYKNDTVYLGYGTDTETYQAWSKKGYIFWLLAEASVAITLMAYFACVVRKYINRFNEGGDAEKKEEEEPKKE
jgi:hypothetical protein